MFHYHYTIEEAKQEIKESAAVYFRKDAKGKYLIPQERQNPFYLVGAPGIGKTQMVKEIAGELGCGFYATSLTHHTRNSILGLPVIRGEEEKYTEYTMPEILAVIKKKYQAGEREGLLLLDEFASMPESLVAPMLAFLQNKSIGNHKLPEGWILILASNPPEYNHTARTFDAAIMDRVRVMEIDYDRQDFISYGETKNLHPAILEFIQTNGGMAYLCSKEKGAQEIVTSRGWENLSDSLYGYEEMQYPVSVRLVRQFIKSDNVASQFFQYYSLRGSCLSTRDIQQILRGADTGSYQNRLGEASFDEKWRTMNLLKNCLSEACRDCSEDIFTKDVLVTLLEVMEADTKKESPCGSNYHQCLAVQLGRENMFGMRNVLFDPNLDDRMASLLQDKEPEIFEEILEELNEIPSRDDSIFGPEHCSNEQVMELVRTKIQEYDGKVEQKLTEADKKISRAILFAEALGEEKIGLFNGFISMLGKDDEILRVISCRQNEEYVRALTEAA